LAIGQRSQAQNPPFNSNSTGNEGALNITAPGVTLFDPVAMNLNPVVSGIFNFTTINVAAGSTLKFTENKYHGPVYFLASGDVTIAGTMDLSGDNSYGAISLTDQRIPNAAGSGGFSGGIGGLGSNNAPLPGNGPGGGAAGSSAAPSPGYGQGGTNISNQYLVPLIGGSGGGGGLINGAVGGAGGGALLIASSTTITVNGTINALGGNSGNCGGYASGAGGGGAVRLVANTITGVGSVIVVGQGGCGYGSQSGSGLARIETNNGGLNVNGPTTQSIPFALNLPTTGAPSVKITSINGQPYSSIFPSFPDSTINTNSAVPIVVQATNVPIATAVVKIYIFSETGPDQVIPIGPLTGSDASSTATTNITYPPGGTRGYVKATW
jgi:hypothetical protein